MRIESFAIAAVTINSGGECIFGFPRNFRRQLESMREIVPIKHYDDLLKIRRFMDMRMGSNGYCAFLVKSNVE